MKKFGLYLIILVFIPKNILATFIEVRNAGLDSINGIYTQSDTYNNKVRFVNGVYQIRFNYSELWEIRDNATLFQNTTTDDFPPTSG